MLDGEPKIGQDDIEFVADIMKQVGDLEPDREFDIERAIIDVETAIDEPYNPEELIP